MIVPIERSDDDRLADYRLLRGQAALRQHDDEFFVAEGWAAIERTIDSGHELRSVLVIPSRVERWQSQLGPRVEPDLPVYVVDRKLLEDSVGFDLHRGVLASATRREQTPLIELASTARRLAVLEGLNDAENVGVIARAARALGTDGLVLDPTCTDPYARRTVRVSMGEVLHLPTARVAPDKWPDALDDLRATGFETWALTPATDADDIWSLDVPERLALVLGAEGPGLTASAAARATRRVRIPIHPDVDSLNVSHAAAIAFAATSPERRR